MRPYSRIQKLEAWLVMATRGETQGDGVMTATFRFATFARGKIGAHPSPSLRAEESEMPTERQTKAVGLDTAQV